MSLSTVEPGTLFWELSSGHRTDWLVKDQKDLEKMLCELKLMFAAVFTGSVTARGVLSAGDQKFRLAGPSSPLVWLRRVGTRYRPYADIG